MTDPADDLARSVMLHRRALATTVELMASARPADRDRPTPCAGWDLATLVTHLTVQGHGFAAATREGRTDPAVWDLGAPAGDLATAYSAAADELAAAFADPDLGERTVELYELGRSLPGAAVVRIHLTDSYVHGWDLARTLGRPDPFDADIAASVLPVVRAIPDTPDARGPGRAFGPALAVADGHEQDEEVLRRLGRDPAWTPPSGA